MAKRRDKGGREARKLTEAGLGLIVFGVDKVRELRGVMAARSVRAASSPPRPASRPMRWPSRDNGIHLLDVQRLLDLIRTRTPAQQMRAG